MKHKEGDSDYEVRAYPHVAGCGFNVGMSLRDRFVIEMVGRMIHGSWPDDRDWPEMIRKANLGADVFLAARSK